MGSIIDKIRKKGYSMFGYNFGICALLFMAGITLTKGSFAINSIYIRVVGIIFILGSIITLLYSIIGSRKNINKN